MNVEFAVWLVLIFAVWVGLLCVWAVLSVLRALPPVQKQRGTLIEPDRPWSRDPLI